jgi:hypothetical protein
MGGVAYIDRRKIEIDRLAAWLQERVPLHFNFGDKAVSYSWNPTFLAEELREYLTDHKTEE